MSSGYHIGQCSFRAMKKIMAGRNAVAIMGHVHNILLSETKRLQSGMSFLLEKANMERNSVVLIRNKNVTVICMGFSFF